MQSKTFVVPNISCDHCTHTIELEVGDVAGVESVEASLDNKRVTVSWDEPASWEQIESLLREINYPPADTVQIA